MIDDTGSPGSGDRIHRVEHDGDGSFAGAVALAVADLDGIEVTEMEPLYGAVDPSLLDAVERASDDVSARVTFTYRGYRITVDSGGTIEVSPAAGHEDS